MISLRGLHKSFGKKAAVIDLSFDVARGEIFGLLGHNGSGKSTTLGMLLGHVHPDAGGISIGGVDALRDRARAMRKVGAIFETAAFFDYLSGWRNLEILYSLTTKSEASTMREAVEIVGLTTRIHDPVRTYSHGMRQRLALAQALCPMPELLVLDEPTEGLDPEGIQEMRATIERLRIEFGMTVILSSHLLAEVEKLCDRVAVIRAGRLLYCGDWQKETHSAKIFSVELDDETRAARALSEASLGKLVNGELSTRGDVDPADILSLLVSSGVRVRSFQERKITLEDFYLRVRSE